MATYMTWPGDPLQGTNWTIGRAPEPEPEPDIKTLTFAEVKEYLKSRPGSKAIHQNWNMLHNPYLTYEDGKYMYVSTKYTRNIEKEGVVGGEFNNRDGWIITDQGEERKRASIYSIPGQLFALTLKGEKEMYTVQLTIEEYRTIKGEYSVKTTCPNCGAKKEFKVPKGLKYTELKGDEKLCDNCKAAWYEN